MGPPYLDCLFWLVEINIDVFGVYGLLRSSYVALIDILLRTQTYHVFPTSNVASFVRPNASVNL
jgi:hypothetical protein